MPETLGKIVHQCSVKAVVIIAMGTLWLVSAAGALGYLAAYASSAPTIASAPAAWPTSSRLVQESGAANVVVFVHPHCPCSSATLNELNRMLARTTGKCQFTIAFYAPTSMPADWNQTKLRRQAESLKGVRVIDDVNGREAMLFGAMNSGHVVAYASDGKLLFRGGITASRGHEGDNLGEDCVLAAINGQPQSCIGTPTYGCEFGINAAKETCPLCAQEDSQ